jgi:uncharacterized integral membrane protein
MRALSWATRIFIFLFLFAFAIKNTDPVSVHFFFDTDWQAPLVIIVLAFFSAGAALGAISLLGTIFSLRRDASRLRNDLKQAQAVLKTAQPPESSIVKSSN